MQCSSIRKCRERPRKSWITLLNLDIYLRWEMKYPYHIQLQSSRRYCVGKPLLRLVSFLSFLDIHSLQCRHAPLFDGGGYLQRLQNPGRIGCHWQCLARLHSSVGAFQTNYLTRAIFYDEKVYSEPEIFNPDRFMKDGKLDPDVFDPTIVAFGFGRR